MPELLIELFSEEIPARMQAKASKDLQSLFEGELAKAGLKAEAIETYATPRRLALIARGLQPGPDVAKALAEVQDIWVAEGFPDEARLAEIADQTVSKFQRARQ